MVCVALHHRRFFTPRRGPFPTHLLEHILTTILLPVRLRQCQHHSIFRILLAIRYPGPFETTLLRLHYDNVIATILRAFTTVIIVSWMFLFMPLSQNLKATAWLK